MYCGLLCYNTKAMKLRIYLGIDSFLPMRDGNAVVVDALAKAFKKRGHEVFVITPNRKTKAKNLEYEVLYSPSFFKNNNYPIAKLHLSNSIKKHILNSDLPTIVNMHSLYFLCYSLGKFVKKNNIPSLYTLHTKLAIDFMNFTHSKSLTKLLVKKQVKWMQNYDGLSSISKKTYESLIPYGLNNKATCITNGTSIHLPTDFPLTNVQFKEKYGINKNDFILLHVGHLTWQKGFKVIIDTLKQLKDKKFSFTFLSVGEGKDEKAIKKYAKKVNVLDKMHFYGQVNDLETLGMFYSYSDLLFFPSTFDSFSLVSREAAFYKLPTLTIEDCDISYLMEDGKNAFLTKEDSSTFANKIIKIANMDKKNLKIIGEEAKKTLIVSWDDIAIEYEKLYIDIIKSKK